MENIEFSRELKNQHRRAIRYQHGINEGIAARAMGWAALGAPKPDQPDDDARNCQPCEWHPPMSGHTSRVRLGLRDVVGDD